jgi:hypothetical protein
MIAAAMLFSCFATPSRNSSKRASATGSSAAKSIPRMASRISIAEIMRLLRLGGADYSLEDVAAPWSHACFGTSPS